MFRELVRVFKHAQCESVRKTAAHTYSTEIKLEFRSSGLFCAQASGIQFYDVPLDEVKELRFCCDLEPSNARDTNSIWLKCSPTCILGHLAREASAHLVPMLLSGFQVLLFLCISMCGLSSLGIWLQILAINFKGSAFRI